MSSKPSSSGAPKGSKPVVSDPRFAHVHTDPRFQRLPKQQRTVKVDSRFSRMFTDPSFKSQYVDPYGRKIKHDTGASDDLKKAYDLAAEENEDAAVDEVAPVCKPAAAAARKKTKSSALPAPAPAATKSAGKSVSKKASTPLNGFAHGKATSSVAAAPAKSSRAGAKTPANTHSAKAVDDDASDDEGSYASFEIGTEDEAAVSDVDSAVEVEHDDDGGDGDHVMASSSSDDDDDDAGATAMDTDDKVAAEDIPLGDATKRIAVMRLDWTRVTAVDLLVLFRSFAPAGGVVESITIYPSEFGLQRMDEEMRLGPRNVFKDKGPKDDPDADPELDPEKVRKYEQDKLLYYYAVLTCDSERTARHIYQECEGTEFERSSNIIDLRFIPDDMEFDHEPKDQASDVPKTGYKAPDFTTAALQLTKTELTWDQDDPVRVQRLQRQKFNKDQWKELDLQAYLGSDDGLTDAGYGTDALVSTSESPSDTDEDADDDDDQDDEDGHANDQKTASAAKTKNGKAAAAQPKRRKVALKRRAREKYKALLDIAKSLPDTPAAGAGDGDDDDDDADGAEEAASGDHASSYESRLKDGSDAEGDGLQIEFDDDDAGAGNIARSKKSKAKTGTDRQTKGDKHKKRGGDDVEMEITFEPGLKDVGKKMLESAKKKEQFSSMNAWDKYLEQRKQKRKERKREREQAEAGDDQNGDAAPPGDSLLEDDEEELSKHQIDWNDPFFSSALGADAGARKAAKQAAKKGAQAEPEETEESKQAKAKERAELELLLMDEGESADKRKGFSLKTLVADHELRKKGMKGVKALKKKLQRQGLDEAAVEEAVDRARAIVESSDGKRGGPTTATGASEDGFAVDTQDQRFAALYEKPEFHLDPTNPSFKSTEATEAILRERQARLAKRRQDDEERVTQRKKVKLSSTGVPSGDVAQTPDANDSGAASELASLVSSIKRKSVAALRSNTNAQSVVSKAGPRPDSSNKVSQERATKRARS